MYTLSIQRNFIAQLLISENAFRSYRYKAELMVEGEELDSNGYVLDIEELGAQFDGIIDGFADKTLNDIDDFEGENPSIENFCRILCEKMDEALYAPNITAISIKLWINEAAWVVFDLDR